MGETLAVMPDAPNPKLGHPDAARGPSAAAVETVAPPVHAAAGFPLLPLSVAMPGRTGWRVVPVAGGVQHPRS